jgi:hypothetical protein
MIESVRTNLARLEPINDRVFRSPMTEEELTAIERDVGMAIPSCVREYFRLVGLRQDLNSYQASEYEVFEHAGELLEQRQFLLKNFDSSAAALFPFAGDGAGNVVAAAQGKDCCTLFFADHETGKITEIGTFCDWLAKVVEAALKQERPLTSEKKWCVQFVFRVPTQAPIVHTLRQFGEVRVDAWSPKKVTRAGVETSEARLTLGSEELLFKKSEYYTWTQPMFSFNYDEPATVPQDRSKIRKLDEAFRAADLGYKLVDYGVLFKEDEDSQPRYESPGKPWWKFW